MKIALVVMPNVQRTTPSIALAYLASSLLKKGHEVFKCEFNLELSQDQIDYFEKLDQYRLGDKALHNPFKYQGEYAILSDYVRYCAFSILNKTPEVVGFYYHHINRLLTLLVADTIRKLNSEVKIIFGGPNTFEPDEPERLLCSNKADYVVVGEGDLLLPEILSKIEKKEQIDYEQVYLLNKGEVSCGKNTVPEVDINDYPFPVFELDTIKKSKEPNLLPIIMSRGCPGQCDFCQEKKYWVTFRSRKPENIISEIKTHINSYGIDKFVFCDSLINGNMVYLKKFCQMLIEQNINIKWGGYVRIHKSFTDSFFKLMFKSGCRYLQFGVESASDRLLKEMNKGIKRELCEKNILEAYQNKLWVHIFIMVGYPTETTAEFLDTLKWIVNYRKYINSITVTPFCLHQTVDIYLKKGVKSIDLSEISWKMYAAVRIIKKSVSRFRGFNMEDQFTYIEKNQQKTIHVDMEEFNKLIKKLNQRGNFQ